MAPVVVGPIDDFGVLGAGTAFPEKRYTNREVLSLLPAAAWPRRHVTRDDELEFLAAGMEETLGVKSRAWAHVPGTPFDHAKEESVFDLGLRAAQAALADAGIPASDVRALVCTTSTPHRMTSTLSAAVGAALGVHGACMDVRTGCAGGFFGLLNLGLLSQADEGPFLLVGAETFSKVLPPVSRTAALTLADGAGALVVGRRKGALLRSVSVESDGTLADLVRAVGPLPPVADAMARGDYMLSGNPEALTAKVLERYGWSIASALERAKLTVNDVDAYVPHQPSREMVELVAKAAHIPVAKVFMNTHLHANVGAAGWLVALAEARESGFVKPGQTVLHAGVGGGMSWGGAVWKWS